MHQHSWNQRILTHAKPHKHETREESHDCLENGWDKVAGEEAVKRVHKPPAPINKAISTNPATTFQILTFIRFSLYLIE